MNKIFNSNRFFKLLLNNYKQYTNALTNSGFMLLIVPAIGLFESIVGGGATTNHNTRVFVLGTFTLIFTISTIYKMYGGANIKKGVVDFLMLPASSFEKFLAMTLICLIINPILFFAASWGIDCLLTFVGLPAYREYISFNDVFNPDNLSTIHNMFILCTALLCGNMIFKKSKFIKTMGVILISFIVVGGIFAYTLFNYVNREFKDSTGYNISELANNRTLADSVLSNSIDSVLSNNIESTINSSKDSSISITVSGNNGTASIYNNGTITSGNNNTTITTNKSRSTITTYNNGVKSTYHFNSNSLNSDNWRFIEEQFAVLGRILKFIYNIIAPIILLAVTYLKIRKQEV